MTRTTARRVPQMGRGIQVHPPPSLPLSVPIHIPVPRSIIAPWRILPSGVVITTSHRAPMPLPSCSITFVITRSIRISISNTTAGRRRALQRLWRQTGRWTVLQIDPGQILDGNALILKRKGHFGSPTAEPIRTRYFHLVIFPW